MLIHVRKNWGILFVMLLVTLPLPFITKNEELDSMLIWLLPVSPIVAEGFLGPRTNTWPNIMFWLLVALIIVNNWLVYFI